MMGTVFKWKLGTENGRVFCCGGAAFPFPKTGWNVQAASVTRPRREPPAAERWARGAEVTAVTGLGREPRAVRPAPRVPPLPRVPRGRQRPPRPAPSHAARRSAGGVFAGRCAAGRALLVRREQVLQGAAR